MYRTGRRPSQGRRSFLPSGAALRHLAAILLLSLSVSACGFVERQATAVCVALWNCDAPIDGIEEIAALPYLANYEVPFPEPAADLYLDVLFAPPGPAVALHARIETPKRPLQCVPYAREMSGVQIRGDARTWWQQAKGRYARSGQPALGAVLVLKPRGASRGHVAVVTHMLNDREIVVEHSNWLNRGRVHKDTPVRDVSPKGDWSAVRVWYTPGRKYGARTYRVYGFILPSALTAAR